MAATIELPQGTLDLLILQTLALAPQHGWAISERVQQASTDALRIQQGSLYPALHRLERRRWIKARWGVSENHRHAKYYELTKTGRPAARTGKRCLVETHSSNGAGARNGIGGKACSTILRIVSVLCSAASASKKNSTTSFDFISNRPWQKAPE